MSMQQGSRQGLRKSWTLEDVREILAGGAGEENKLLLQDRKGLSPVNFAVLQAAKTADSLLPLLELLEPPTEDEIDKINRIIQLLEKVVENQISLGQRMVALESAYSGRGVPSRGTNSNKNSKQP